jgi:hypothetical protein
MMHGRGKSDGSIVPTKSPNNAATRAAEAMEGRGLAKGNSFEAQRPPDTAPEKVRQARSAGTADCTKGQASHESLGGLASST